MKKPKYKNYELKIMGETWKVEFVNEVLSPIDGNRAYGLCDWEKRTLFIDQTFDNKTVMHTILHEMFHAYVRRSGIYNANLSHELEEIIADQYALVLSENFDFNIL